ncbi:MAG TPA: fasciclin domain-containing protein [Chitinophaga sp.]|uniref:fasciclin domain-containing protein n=1 Tax=Chitinophaga sp. TaxID=1869181 RepID=UPI002CB3A0E8|nr:fasciclin domain-containing protein [Chitinophaga sp.]HVI44039.1 fasciclin domain-containing protein [Chitinophaga sp.]
MQIRKLIINGLLPALCLLFSCKQEDLQVTPIGEPVPYTGISKNMTQLLDSTNYSILKAIWKKANMDAVMRDKAITAYTLLAPTDAAFEAAGINMTSVNNMSVEDADTLLHYHLIANRISPASLKTAVGNIGQVSLLQADIPDYSPWSKYVYRHFIGIHGGKLMIDGRTFPLKALEATNGTIYELNEVLQRPKEDMLSYLQNDPRFSMFLEALRINDSVYYPFHDYAKGLPSLRNSDKTAPFTVFAPTNEAFAKAGFHTSEDLMALATRYPVGDPFYDDDYYYQYPVTSLDSLLLPHRSNIMVYGSGASFPIVFLSNDLTDNPGVTGFIIRTASPGQAGTLIFNLEFTHDGDNISVRRLKSKAPFVPVVEKDKFFLNGVIHVVNDGLFVP